MRFIVLIIVLCICLCSCVQLKIAEDKRIAVTDLGIAYEFNDKVEDEYKPRIDSVITFVVNQFNSEHHSFLVHKAVKENAYKNCLLLRFEKAHYRSTLPIAASFIITSLGVLITPFAVMTVTNGQAFILFWYLASDKINISETLSSDIADLNNESKFLKVRTGATFSNKKKRLDKMSNKLGDCIYSTLIRLDKRN